MSQPEWKLVAQLGDASPIEYGGYFIYEDATGVYPPEAELLLSPDDDDSPERWQVYRFRLDRCTFINGVLSDNPYHPDHPTWFADTMSALGDVWTMGKERDLIEDICSEDTICRAIAYREIGEHEGFINFDEHPLTFRDRHAVESRYADHTGHTPSQYESAEQDD